MKNQLLVDINSTSEAKKVHNTNTIIIGLMVVFALLAIAGIDHFMKKK